MAKIDLDKIKNEIQTRKQEITKSTSPLLGENVQLGGGAPRDEFLNGLLSSLKTGQETPASNLIKVVENSVAEKHGGVGVHKINENKPIQKTPQRQVQMSPDREEQMYKDFSKNNNQTLAESISSYTGEKPNTGNNANYNGQQFLTSLPEGAQIPNMGGQINEAALNEGVQKMVNDHLSTNLGPIFEEAIKNTVIEMYAVERIKEVLSENKDLIKDAVKEVIREIKNKNK